MFFFVLFVFNFKKINMIRYLLTRKYYNTTFINSKFFNHIATKIILLFFIIFNCSSFAQNYNWQWAIHGGGDKGGITGYTPEEIYDVKVGTDNNYYFIASVEGNYDVKLNGVHQTAWNNYLGNKDIFLFSTTCDGTVRWSRAIGGGGTDESYNLVLDSNNNIYISCDVRPWLDSGPPHFPVHFSQTEWIITPYDVPSYNPQWPPDQTLPMEFYKSAYIVKYDTNGNYVSRKAIQSDELAGVDFYASTEMYRAPHLYNLMIDSQDNLHLMGVFGKGNYFDNHVNIPQDYYYNAYTGKGKLQYRMIKCNSNLEYIDDMILPVKDSTGFSASRDMAFAYDEVLNQYYIAGTRSWGTTATSSPLTYENKPIVNLAYLLAIRGMNSSTGAEASEVWRREIYSPEVNGYLGYNSINAIVIDQNSDVFVAGKIWKSYGDSNLKIYDPNDPSTTTYNFNPAPHTGLPVTIKFNSSGALQWLKHPTSEAANFTTNTSIMVESIALNGNEVAIGSSEGYFVWDSFSQNYPQFHGVSPTVLRFNKQTGLTVGMDFIVAPPGAKNYLTALATDNDGNYISGGIFSGILGNNTIGMGQLISNGPSDFFVAKLGKTSCNTASTDNGILPLKINVYPNPTSDLVNFETEEQIIGYFIYNEAGQKMQATTRTTHNIQQLNLEGFASGVYFVAIKTISGKTSTVKIIKK